jgi:hypothetical protein
MQLGPVWRLWHRLLRRSASEYGRLRHSCGDIALGRLVEQAVPRRNGGACLCLGQALCRGGKSGGQQGGGDEYELSELFMIPSGSSSGRANQEHRHRRHAQDALAETAARRAFEPALSAGRQHDHVGAECVRLYEDLRAGLPEAHDRL